MVEAARRWMKWSDGGDPDALKGTGVIAGVVDFGFDCSGACLEPAVDVVWDQIATSGGTPHPLGGRILVGGERLQSKDLVGHGSDVAAILGGRGDPLGFAPEVRLALVRVDPTRWGVIRAVRWLFDYADEVGLPMVVNLSLGTAHLHAHDGSDLLCREIDSLTGPGRIVVAAAGNNGDRPLHVRLQLPESAPVRTPLVGSSRDFVRRRNVDPGPIQIAAYGSDDRRFGVRVLAGDRKSSLISDMTGMAVIGDHVGTAIGNHLIRLDCLGDGESKRPCAYVQIDRDQRLTNDSDTYWWLEFTPLDGPMVIDAWSVDSNGWFMQFDRTDGVSISNDVVRGVTLNSPAVGRSVVAVGAFDDRSDDGCAVCDFSGVGPTLDGRRKPEVVAPGRDIVALGDRSRGTSFASPMVAAAVALLLQCEPTLDPSTVQEILKCSARIPIDIPGDPKYDPSWGYGVVTGPALDTEMTKRGMS